MAQKVEGNPRETGVRKENATEKANTIFKRFQLDLSTWSSLMNLLKEISKT